MALVIGTNVMSLTAQRSLGKSQNDLATRMQRLSTGLRINAAKDDAAGLAISDRMESQVRGLNQAARNANDAISLSATAEGAMQEVTVLLQRMRDLAVQSANDTNTAQDRANLQKEVVQLQAEIDRIAGATEFNGTKLLDGTFTAKTFHIGANANQTLSVSVSSTQTTAMGNNTVTDNLTASVTSARANTRVNNLISGDTFTISGELGTSAQISFATGASAETIAAAVNNTQGSTGVSAVARTQATISAVAVGQTNFHLRGNGATTVEIDVNVVNASDLKSLADAINAQRATTGIEAVNNGSTVTLIHAEGENIVIHQMSDGAFTLNGLSDVGVSLTSIATLDQAAVGGRVTLQSSAAFSYTDIGGVVDDRLFASTTSALSGVNAVNVSTQSGSNTAIDIVDAAIKYIDNQRADLGAIQNRLDSTISNLMNVSENIAAARSRIVDADFASETARLTQAQILQQAGVAMLAQANAAPQVTLSLLQG